MTTDSDTIPIQHEYLTTSDFAVRAARAYTAFALTRPAALVTIPIVAVAGVVSLIWGVATSDLLFTIIGFAYAAIPFALAAIVYSKTRRGTAKRLPAGSRLGVGLGATAMRIESPLGSSEPTYRSYTRAHRRGDFVILRLLGVRAYSIMPIELFPGDDFERLSDGIARAGS